MSTTDKEHPAASSVPSSSASYPIPANDERDVEAITNRMIERNFAANSLDELFDATTGKSSDDMVGHTVTIETVEWDVYESDKGPIPLAIMAGTDHTADAPLEFITTSPMLTSFVRKCEIGGWLPVRVRIEGKRTRSGQTALNFVRP